jgi:hypothetical protein
MNHRERRNNPRVDTRVELQYRALGTPELPLQRAESENISQRGIFFMTDDPPKVGTLLEISLQMPPELGVQLGGEVRCLARVVRIQHESAESERSGIGLHIEQFEAGSLGRERWVS